MDTSAVRTRIAERLANRRHKSEESRQYFEKLAGILSFGHDPDVDFVSNVPTAFCKQQDEDVLIGIADHRFQQPVSDIPDDTWQMVIREGLLIHEIGHVLYTDAEAKEAVFDQIDIGQRDQFHQIVFNPAEDAAIEEQLRQSFNCSKLLDLTRANLHALGKDDADHLPLMSAVKVAILEKGCYDTGIIEGHRRGDRQLVPPFLRDRFDELLDEVDDLLVDVMTEPNARVRYERMLEFWEMLCEEVPDQNTSNDPFEEILPDDDGAGTAGEPARELDDLDEDEVRKFVEAIGDDSDGEEDDEEDVAGGAEGDEGEEDGSDEAGDESAAGGAEGDESDGEAGGGGSSGGDESDDDDGGKSPERSDVGEAADEIGDEYEEKVDELTDEESEQEAANSGAAYASASEDIGEELKVIVGRGSNVDDRRWGLAQDRSEDLARVIQERFRIKQLDRKLTHQRHGRFDSNRMIAADRGSPNVFTQIEEGDEPDYEVYFVLDRSGSMDGWRVNYAEVATATIMLAMEEAGVPTELVDFFYENPRLVKTKSQSVEEEAGNIVQSVPEANKGTPLGAVMELLRERLRGSDATPIVVTVTDAKVRGATRERYLDAVRSMDTPVLGVKIDDDSQSVDVDKLRELYHSHVTVERGDDVTDATFELIRGVMNI